LAARINPSKGSKPDKLMRQALLLELGAEHTMPDGVKVKKLRLVAKALVTQAIDGDVAAIKEINDRVDGKVPQAVQGTVDGTLSVIIKKMVDEGE